MLIYDLTFDELTIMLKNAGFSNFRVSQIWDWLYKKQVASFEQMTNLSKDVLTYLISNFTIAPLTEVLSSKSADGTYKILFSLNDGNIIETVIMNHNYGHSICVTTQVGCNMGCSFCASGIIKKKRDLTAGEIVAQIIYSARIIQNRIDSVVVMGIGEPFDNYQNLVKFLAIINHPKGLAIGARHITVSTCGIIPKILEFASLGVQYNLAISLHASNNDLRSSLMNINKRFPLDQLIEAIKDYIDITNRRVTIEYILIKNVNDQVFHAEELSRLLKGLNVYVNLIPYNPVKENSYERSDKQTQLSFYDILKKNKIQVTLRKEQGTDIDAACGQLRIQFENKKG